MNPNKIIQLKAEEEIMAVVHENIIPFLPKLLFLFLWFVIPFFFLFPLIRYGTIGIVIFVILVLSALFFIIKFFIKWGNTILVITDRRIVDVNQKALFNREVTETPFTSIDEASHQIKGIVPTIFRYGILRLATTGESADIEFYRVKRPVRLQNLINDLRNVFEDEEVDQKKERVSKLADSMSDQEIEDVRRQVKAQEQETALKRMFVDDEENPFKVKRDNA